MKISIMKNYLFVSVLFLSIVSCNKDDIKPANTVTVQNFTANINENVTNGLSVGIVQATGNGTLNYSIVTQTPAGALTINSGTGELSVANNSLFDYETIQIVTATVAVNNSGTVENLSATINLLDVHEVGEYKFGGVIFWVNSTGKAGLACTTTDQNTNIQWYNGSYGNTGASGAAVGTGQANTTAIINFQGAGTYAAKICDDLTLNGFSNWYLPSEDELNQMYINRAVINSTSMANGGTAFLNSYYWSSTESNTNNARNQDFATGTQANTGKGIFRKVRAIRSWTDF